jgi:hypothetical protein
MYVFGSAWIVGTGAAMEAWGELAGLVFFVAILPLVFLAFPGLIGLVARGRRMRALPADELLRREGRAPVVLLRSFGDDDLIDPTFTATYEVVPGRYEERLVKALAALGPPIAIGRPGERDPQLGAARLYVKDEHWQRAIEYFMERAAAIVAVVGGSPGLWWEIEFAMERAPAERLLFFFPYPAPPGTRRSFWRAAFLQHQVWGRFVRRKLFPAMDAERRARYAAFRDRVNARLPHPLPEGLGDARFIAFSPEGRPILLEPAAPSLWTRALSLNFDPRMDIPFERELRPFVRRRLMRRAGRA